MYTKKYISRTFYNGSDSKETLSEAKSETSRDESYTGVPFIKTAFAKKLPFVFDPDYFIYVEDVDFAYYLRLIGKTLYRAPRAIVYHDRSLTTKQFFDSPFKSYLVERNTLQTYLKNLELHNLILWFPYFMAPRILKFVVCIITFKFSLASAALRAWYWNCIHLHHILIKRKIVQAQRVVSDKAIFARMGGERGVIKYFFS